ncbi:hypothetical protein A2G94_02300 [Francisella endosymbiont of Ornithodoros moubata]|nr:hypothetical protein A2G94_02300 [Francisella endosymbiont of Ornithodoros moubata]
MSVSISLNHEGTALDVSFLKKLAFYSSLFNLSTLQILPITALAVTVCGDNMQDGLYFLCLDDQLSFY